MLKSMTGFGQAVSTGAKGILTAEIKSVNSRFLEINIRTNRFSSVIEESIRKRIKNQVKRGKISVNLSFETLPGSDNIHVSIDKALLKAYLNAFAEIRKMKCIKNSKPTIKDLLALPEPFLSVEKDTVSDEELIPLVEQAIDEALTGLNDMRLKEGAQLASDIRNRIHFLQKEMNFLEGKQEQINLDYETRLRTKMKKLLKDINGEIEESRLLQEVAIYSEKTDFTEELVRFKSHLLQFETALTAMEPVGRKLDFLIQEIQREVNTTASKANDMDVINCVIIIKTELEKIREQVQNIE